MSAQWREMPRIRRMVNTDLDAVVAIEREVFLFPWTPEEAHLLTLGIAAEFQRKGWGERLLRHFIHIAREQRALTMFLDVRVSNHAAARLYERMGFRKAGKRKGYYPAMGGREDSLVMELVL